MLLPAQLLTLLGAFFPMVEITFSQVLCLLVREHIASVMEVS